VRIRIALLLVVAFAAAVRADETVLGANPDLVAGAAALERGRYEEGVALTRAGLVTVVSREQRASGLNNLCAGYTALGLYDAAIVHCTESLALDEARWQAYNNRALAYLGKGMLRLARRDVARGLELNPLAQRLLQVAAMVEEAAGRRPNAPEKDPIA
jgi:tetratricopeptide (TPR) repeat protein